MVEARDAKVLDWLNEQGYPLEFEVAAAFAAAGFRTDQGSYVRSESGKPREIDVVAGLSEQVGKSFVRVSFVIECKWSRKKPWVIFVGDHMATSACIAQTTGTRAARTLLWAKNANGWMTSLGLFRADQAAGFNGRQAFTEVSEKDQFYAALQGVVGAANRLVAEEEPDVPSIERDLKYVAVVWPVVVVDGLLYEARYNGSASALEIREVKATRVHWRGAESSRGLRTTVDVVSADHVASYAKERATDAQALLEILGSGVHELDACLAAGYLDALKLEQGSSGLGRKPVLYRLLSQRFASPRPSDSPDAVGQSRSIEAALGSVRETE